MTAYQLFKRLSLIGAILALCVVVLGAYVRLSDAGLGCPDWPGCYGELTVPETEEAIKRAQEAYPHLHIEAEKAWKEMLHRYLAGSLGMIVLALFVLGWKSKQIIKTSPFLTSALLVVIILQAMLGMWTVTMQLKPVIVSAHLMGGMATLGMLTWVAHRHWMVNAHKAESLIVIMLRLALLVLAIQVFLGGWTSSNYAALACTDFPTCHGVFLPDMNFSDAFTLKRELGLSGNGESLSLASLTAIQWVHRIGALIILVFFGFVGCALLKSAKMRAFGVAMLLVLVMQVTVGIANLILHLPLVLAVMHNFGAALLVIITVLANSKITIKNKSSGWEAI